MTRVNLATELASSRTLVRLNYANTFVVLDGHLDGVGTSGVIDTAGTLRGLVGTGPSGSIQLGGSISVTGIPVSTDQLDVQVRLVISDLTLTNWLELSHTFLTTAGDTELEATLNESTMTPSIDGADFSITGGMVTTVAGGVFLVGYQINIGWD